MHETHIIGKLLEYLTQEEDKAARRIKRISIALSEFGGITPAHFMDHYHREARGTKWERVEVELKKIPYGPELELTQIMFE